MKEKKPVEFPSSFSQTKGTIKPTPNVPNCCSLDVLRNKAASALYVVNVPIDFVISYFHLVNLKLQQTFHLMVNSTAAGSEIDSFFMVSIIPIIGPDVDVRTSQQNLNEKDDKWLTMWVLSLYRVERPYDVSYRDIKRTLTEQMRIAGRQAPCNCQQGPITLTSWSSSAEYRKVVKCTDWFFFNNNTHPWANIRVATIGSRYKDCAALSPLFHITRV